MNDHNYIRKTLLSKQGDLWLQIFAAVLPLVAIVFAGPTVLVVPYFTVGAVQLFSCINNKAYLHKLIMHRARTTYEITLLAISGILLLFLVTGYGEGLWFMLAVLLVASPFMALWYGHMTLKEIKLMKEVLLIINEEQQPEEPISE